MQVKFTVQIDSFKKISKIPNAWSGDEYKALLTLMDFDDDVEAMDAAELREMCMMSLNDQEPAGAAKVVLTHLFPELSAGKVDQISHDMLDDRSWEEYPDCLLHERFFSAYALLREAFNGTFAKPTGVELAMTVTAEHIEDMAIFDESLHSSIVRLLANGQGDDALINRLYEDQIKGTHFPEAPGLVWQLKQVAGEGTTRQFSLVSSYFWMENFEQVESFEAESHADEEE
ncbi:MULTISPECIES: hypothetical protein [Marinomonas]|uniref:Uncharacterized protein n=1 Tax=Marinomonas arctica TaxID=383750 RepID=A0A7H1J2U2_9GAMM|nr:MULTISPECIES: hypothetical protein [Marinomonas]MCS7486518.1 hypothetical protein [Marinomonas sp. BSi20414]QNT04808.1 hypothetical protein IBG28_13965 [Marinomonas arctica]GGN31017.1 hypothetical protein GCM10011350_24310 [Marinomonas arctica]